MMTVLIFGLLIMIALLINGFFFSAFFVGFLTVYLMYRHVMKKAKALNEAVEAVSKEAYPEIYKIAKEKAKNLK